MFQKINRVFSLLQY